ncbi:hypothetical protein [Streptomyces sp. CB03911]|uniref:hypothetical protein n=1 Tax=Streptomyces sp. CB03911 TaxID=1804758 RepID=UPI00093F1442|nr:hypothetical protein [Streptomyces sp. CB03911]OKI22208.1 hypothetical protein A6A07_34605 [Streptomyces sp. CB03911]
MVLGPFATADDLQARLIGMELTETERAQADRLLADASALIRMTAGYQQISRVDNDTVTLRTAGPASLRLPQRPVLAVSAVAGLTTDQWWWDGGVWIYRSDGYWCGPATVTYSHGLAEDEPAYQVARSVACDAVKRIFTNPLLIRQRSIDDYAETLADARASLMAGEADTIRLAFAGPNWGLA